MLKEEVRIQNPGVRISWMGIQTPTNCEHRTDGGDLNPFTHPPVVQEPF
ncbi:MAG: hypothetical protein ACREPR_22335 [Brasilonema sp.]